MTRCTATRSRLVLVVTLAAMASVVALACGDAGNPPPGTTTTAGEDASADRAAIGDARADAIADGGTGDAQACSVPPLGGAIVTARYLAAVPPADTGGTITAGTYDLTDLEIYLGIGEEGDPDGGLDGGAMDTAQATFVMTADMLALSKTASPLGGGAPNITKSVAKQHVSDVFLITDDTCPTTDSRQTPFTATPTTVTLHTAQTRREIYTRRP